METARLEDPIDPRVPVAIHVVVGIQLEAQADGVVDVPTQVSTTTVGER